MGSICPVGDLLIDCPNGIACSICKRCLNDDEWAYSDLGRDCGLACKTCGDKVLEDEKTKAEEFARDNCRITEKPHRYNSSYRYAPTRDDYEDGDREAYTENSVAANNRHRCTNYEELLERAGLSKSDTSDIADVRYNAIRERISFLLEEYLDEHWDDEDDALGNDEDEDGLLE
jgi:hypothetical protein